MPRSRTVTDPDAAILQDLLDTYPWNNTINYGIKNSKDPKPCRRIKDAKYRPNNPLRKKYKYGSSTIEGYRAAYVAQNKEIPNKNLIHVCGNPYNYKSTTCIEASHIEKGDQTENNQRRKCHTKIRKWEKTNRHKYKIIGHLYVADVGKIIKWEQQQNTLRRSSRLGKKRKTITPKVIKNMIVHGSGQETHYQCGHSPFCFINYNQLN